MMQFFNQLYSVVRQNRPLIQRSNLLINAQRFTVSQPARAVSNRSQDENVSDILSNIPEKPKRPPGPWIRYLKSVSPKLIKENPNFSQKDIVRKAGEMWRSADKESVLIFQSEYFVDMEDYNKALQSYEKKLTEEQKEALEELKSMQKEGKESKKLKKKLIELGKPKKPPNAYILFSISKYTGGNQGKVASSRSGKIAEEYRNLPAEEKNAYIEKANALQEQYQRDKAQWEAKMKESGHENLLKTEVKTEVKKEVKKSTVKTSPKTSKQIKKDSLSKNLKGDSNTSTSVKNVISSLKADKVNDKITKKASKTGDSNTSTSVKNVISSSKVDKVNDKSTKKVSNKGDSNISTSVQNVISSSKADKVNDKSTVKASQKGDSNPSTGVKNVISLSKADKLNDKSTKEACSVSSEKEHNYQSSPSDICDTNLKPNSGFQRTSDRCSLDEVTSNSKKDIFSQLKNFFNSPLYDKIKVPLYAVPIVFLIIYLFR